MSAQASTMSQDLGMLIVYVDETGDPSGPPSRGGSPEYALGVVVVDSKKWQATFDGLIQLRRRLRASFGIPATAEVKASDLIRNEGWFKGARLSASQKKYVYRQHLRALEDLEAQAFAVWVDKRSLEASGRLSATRTMVWEMLFQRLQRTFATEPLIIVHDEGEELTIRKLARKARRYLSAGSAFGRGSRRGDLANLMDDTVARRSHESLLVQCADLVAYAAAKAMIPGGSRASRVCPPGTWEILGDACIEAVNSLARRSDPNLPPGIAVQR